MNLILVIFASIFLTQSNMQIPVIVLNQSELETFGFMREKDCLKLQSNIDDILCIFKVYTGNLEVNISFDEIEKSFSSKNPNIVLITDTYYKVHFNTNLFEDKKNYLPVLVSFCEKKKCKQYVFFFEENEHLQSILRSKDKYESVSKETISSILNKK